LPRSSIALEEFYRGPKRERTDDAAPHGDEPAPLVDPLPDWR
jgi:hypothetical protein